MVVVIRKTVTPFQFVGGFLPLLVNTRLCKLPGQLYKTSQYRKHSLQYLHDFYDMNMSDPASERNGFLLSQKIMEMQQFFHLRLTGTLDEDTMEEIEKPRCGYPDVKSFTLFGGSPRWPRNTVTYRYSCFANIDVDQAIAEAFKVWSDVTPLKFLKRNSGNADIVIFSAAGNHGDGGNSRFDGRNGVLAHAYAPGRGIGGDTHFDAAERWSLTSNGINFFLVAAHEFGHALGLGHSNDRRALMFPTYKYVNTRSFRLPSDDVRGIQTLYGKLQSVLLKW
uniref:Peptidase metallopeptidase domain-containing protein n=1 Tax=Callorhinchus milii TaxID=7868 RepID=A0A4W3H8Z6_CALMI